jgi:dUTP pyrophosphatase
MKIKVKLFEGQHMPEMNPKGRWIDLCSNEDISMKAPMVKKVRETKNGEPVYKVVFDTKKIHTGVAMELPKGFEALLASRSSTPDKFKIVQRNVPGVIDGETYRGSKGYNGDNDEWLFNVEARDTCHIKKGDRICQFRIQLSHDATIWQKLRWLFSRKIELVQVDKLEDVNRGGFGSTDKEVK